MSWVFGDIIHNISEQGVNKPFERSGGIADDSVLI